MKEMTYNRQTRCTTNVIRKKTLRSKTNNGNKQIAQRILK